MDERLLGTIRGSFRTAERILIVSHIRPDGDAVGSMLGLGLALKASGKQVYMVLPDGVPGNYRHLVGSDEISRRYKEAVDLIVSLDSSDLKRIGEPIEGRGVPDLNIDHHVTNLNYGKINLVDPEAVSTSEIIAKYLDIWGLKLTQPVADALLTGMITDTIGFRTSNMSPAAFRTAAHLLEMSTNISELYEKSLLHKSFEAARLWGAGLLSLERSDQIIWATLTMADRKAVGYPGRDDADLINFLSTINDAAVYIVFVEQPAGKVKVSWRSQHSVDVSGIAVQFGGGGHPAAAGAEIAGNLDQVRSAVLKETAQLLVPA